MSNQSLIVKIIANAQGYVSGIGRADSATRRFGAQVRAEFSRMKSLATSLHGQLAGLGVAVGFAQLAKDTAVFERDMRQLQVNLGASRDEMEAWRREAFENQKRYGTLLADQKELADSLQAAGLDLTAIRAAAEPVSKTLAVAKTSAEKLGQAMGVAREQFGVDISDKQAAEELLDKMVVSGRLGNAELENLPDIFARVGGRAKEANFTMDQTLALVEALSKSEPQAERLATLVDSTLRVFTNAKYMKDATKATGVSFFDVSGARRNPIDVIKDIKIAYDKLKTDAERNSFLDAAFGKTDMDTQRGLKKALEDGTLAVIDGFYKQIQNASGTVDKDLKTAMDNAVTQANRLKGALQEAVENGLTRPISEAFTNVTKFLMDDVSEGGLGMDGKDMLKVGGGIAAISYLGGLLVRMRTGKGGGSIADDVFSTAKGVAAGKALESIGVQPVYVVNMPSGGVGGDIPGMPDIPGKNGKGGKGMPGNPSKGSVGGAAAGGAAKAGQTVGNAARSVFSLKNMFGVGLLLHSESLNAGEVERMMEMRRKFTAANGAGDPMAAKRLAMGIGPEVGKQAGEAINQAGQAAAQGLKQAGDAVATESNAVWQALIAQVNQTKIQGQINVSVTASPLLQVQTTAVGNNNTALNVGKTNTGAK